MMRSGRDYLSKVIPEYEDRRGAHLRELIGTMAAQSPAELTTEPETETEMAETETVDVAKSSSKSMSNKPTLKLR